MVELVGVETAVESDTLFGVHTSEAGSTGDDFVFLITLVLLAATVSSLSRASLSLAACFITVTLRFFT